MGMGLRRLGGLVVVVASVQGFFLIQRPVVHSTGGGGVKKRVKTAREKGQVVQGLSILPDSLPEVPEWAGALTLELAHTVIAWSVPLAGAVFVVAGIKGGGEEPLAERKRNLELEFGLEDASEGSEFPQPPFGRKLGGKKKRNRPSTPSYLKIERLNDRLESFVFDLTAAESGRFAALKERRRRRLTRALGDEVAIGELSEDDLKVIGEAEAAYRLAAGAAKEAAEQARGFMRASAAAPTKDAMDLAMSEDDEDEGESSSKKGEATNGSAPMAAFSKMFETAEREKALQEAVLEEARAEAEFLRAVSSVVPNINARTRLTQLVFAAGKDDVGALVADAVAHGAYSSSSSSSSNETAVAAAADDNATTAGPAATAPLERRRRRVFVLDFDGDVSASQTNELRQEITALLQVAEEHDEVLLKLSSGGGTVTGYGSAAGQLTRLKAAGLKLTVCVEQVAASGGYLMACAADHLIASPFAVLGSIGVISDVPNVYERLLREGVEFQTVTAGKFKRTVTPTKKVTKEDLAKSKQDLEDVLTLFKAWVRTNRPKLDIDAVATGETWYGDDALDKGLCDELATFDDVLLRFLHDGADVFSIRYSDPKPQPAQLLDLLQSFGRTAGAAAESPDSLRWWYADHLFDHGADVDLLGELGLALRRRLVRGLLGLDNLQLTNKKRTPPFSKSSPPAYMLRDDPPTFF